MDPAAYRERSTARHYVTFGANERMSAECAAITNTGFVVGDEAVVIIDGGGAHGKVGAFVRQCSRSPTSPIRCVINTHDAAFEATARSVGHRN